MKTRTAYFRRNNQYWAEKANGAILLIEINPPKAHSGTLFVHKSQLNTKHAVPVSQAEFNKIRQKQINKISQF